MASFANIGENEVITGVQFILVDLVIHLQIQTGKLLPGGYVDPNTIQWQPPNDLVIDETPVDNAIEYYMIDFETKYIDLDVLEPNNKNSVLTGLFITQSFQLTFP